MKRLVLSVFTAICVLSLSIQFPIPVESAVPGAPATPIMLGGFPLSPTQVRVEWADSDNETGFRIERASISANFTEVGSVTANITSFTDDTVAVDTSYQYRVIAFNGAGDSDPSNVISVTVAAPNAPTDLAAFAMSATRVDLVWTDQSNNEASFRIERSLDGFATAPNATFPAVRNQRIFTDNTTSANNTYSYRVIAINAISESADSNVASVIVTSKLQAGPIDPDSIFQSNPNTGLPGYYQDDQGTRVSLLPITGNGIAAPTQIYDPPVLAEPYSVFLGYGTEAFYFYAENVFTMPNGGKVVTVFGIEAAFGGTGNATPGQEFVFNRTRIRIDVPMAGIYTVRHPYGAVSFNVTQADFIATGGRRAINYTNDIGVQRDFSATANDGNITRFLRQTTPSPSAGWIGDGASIGPVTGSPTGFNTVKIIGPPGSNLGGAGIDFVQSNDFMVSGRMPTAVTPIPGFTKTIDPVTSAAPATVTFTDTSTGAPTKWLWEFGDGTSSTSQNPPPKTYSTAGNYLVKLTVTNAVATVSTSQTVAIVSVPVASFVRSLPNGIPPVSINFTDSSTGNPTNWLWSFGDNSTSTLQNPSHIYAAPGTYTVNLTASNLAGVSYSSTLLGISPNLTANFTPSVFSGIAPLSANFTDTSIGNIESWLWDFGDNSTSASQNATKTYNTPGSYTVSLAVTDAVGSAGTSQVVNVYGALTANFTKSLIFGMMPLTVNFNDTSMGNPTSWLWSFGDNTTSTLQNPTKTYTAFGSYRVMLTVTNPTGTASTSQIVYVSTVDPTTLILQVGTNDPNSIYQGNLNTGFPSYYQDDQGTRVGLIPLTEGQIFDPPVADNAYSQLLGYGTEAFYWVASTVSPTSAGQMRALFGIEAAFGGVGDAVPGQEFVFVRTRIFADVPVAGNYTLQHPYGTLTIEVTADDVAAGGLRYVSDMGVQRDFLAAAAPNNGNVSRFLRPVTPAPLGWIGVGTIGPVTGSPLPTPFNKVRLTGPSGSNLGGPGIDFVETGQFAVNGRLFSTLTPSFTISLNPANSVVPVTANFTDTTTGNITAWSWSFGDGTTSILQNPPPKVYNTPGTYLVSLTVTDNSSEIGTTSQALSVFGALVANFTKSAASGVAPLTIAFQDISTGIPASWLWDFGDNTTSTAQNPLKTYTAAGNFLVTLSVTNPTGTVISAPQTVVVTAPGAPVASFTKSATSGVAPLPVSFTDTSSGVPTSWLWDFGDGSAISTFQNPLHTYTAAGTFTVTLTVTNAAGSSSASQTVIVTILAHTVGSTTAPSIPLTGLTSNTGLLVDFAGVVLADARVSTADGKVSLTITQGTKLQTATGQPLAAMTAAPLTATPPRPPPNTTVILPFDFGPDGAKFNPPLTVTMSFDPGALPAGARIDKLQIAYWDGANWVKLGKATVDAVTGTITGEISHFTIFAILAEEEQTPVPPPEPKLASAPEPPTTPTPTPTPALETVPTLAPAEPTPAAEPEPDLVTPPISLNWPLISGLLIAVILVIGLILFITRGNTS